jgi:NADH-quinone oxidoreductase subunit M
MIRDFGGLARPMPVFATFFMIVMLSSIGLPGLNGFVGEFLILLGSFRSAFLGSPWYAVTASAGVILAAVYLLWSYQRVFFGKNENPENRSLTDLTGREIAVLLPVVFFIVWIGVHPSTFLEKSAASTKSLIHRIEETRRGSYAHAAEAQGGESREGGRR